jgi:S-adenosylmethionine-diacylgycerolhomoserine-N-methlytransferase
VSAVGSHATLMDGVYRHQRHIYDLTRKYYLLGRDRLLQGLDVPLEGTVLEIGCGTGRNLKLMADRHPALRLTGIDISEQMLKSARGKIAQARLSDRVTLLHGDAVIPTDRKAQRILMSYSLSMIPDWQRALAVAIETLAPGGIFAIVDFGNFGGLPDWLAEPCIDMLSRHDAPPCLDLPHALQRHASPTLSVRHEYALAGFYQLAIIERM